MLRIHAALCLFTGSLETLVFHTLLAGNIGQLPAPGTTVPGPAEVAPAEVAAAEVAAAEVAPAEPGAVAAGAVVCSAEEMVRLEYALCVSVISASGAGAAA